ncbi:MAG: isoprenyl transferase [Chloroflexi bacterium]|nr:isoprenyl transferase [Ardenticatenaceae bacterium]MBL1128474.1 isoprenyl transferase [Chloroflexota bacterium]NOG34551.1 isoprenyl transferase [Chloroflexota bacterium]GIK56815.1 MAG: isoprenyl transferase [Chloroflexota bacterium]
MAERNAPLDLTGLVIPTHVAIIMDGNGRWAKKRGLPRQAGHRAGAENLRRIINACVEFKIKILTIYAFSTENWGRPEMEVRGLMKIISRVIDQELKDLHAQGVCLHHLGSMSGVAPSLQEKVHRALELTKNNDRLILNVAFNYGGRAEILQAVKQILADNVVPDDLTEDLFSSYLFTRGLPDPDLVIRTSGELRISNFLIWQAAYSEFYPTPTYWPDFGRENLYEAILAFNQRERRFGLVTESPV